tara:strand:- start:542 stop:1288 length:747 start_codon:yes stop_codon:yes gene_type:complete
MITQNIKKICLGLLSIVFLNINAQENKQSAFSFNYNYQIPIKHSTNIYGDNSAIGASYLLENNKNIIFGIECSYMFAANIQDSNIFNNISTSTGAIIGGDGYYANVNPMQRGVNAHLFTGYAFHFKESNLSGIYIYQGVGYLQQQIFIDTKNQNIPQLNEEMKKGYDRLSDGFSTKLSIDYKYYHKKGRLQISSGINYTMAYTKSKRTYNFAENEYYSQKREWVELLGFKIEVIIPIHRKNKEEFHYY